MVISLPTFHQVGGERWLRYGMIFSDSDKEEFQAGLGEITVLRDIWQEN